MNVNKSWDVLEVHVSTLVVGSSIVLLRTWREETRLLRGFSGPACGLGGEYYNLAKRSWVPQMFLPGDIIDSVISAETDLRVMASEGDAIMASELRSAWNSPRWLVSTNRIRVHMWSGFRYFWYTISSGTRFEVWKIDCEYGAIVLGPDDPGGPAELAYIQLPIAAGIDSLLKPCL